MSWTLAPEGDGTRLRLVHAGFIAPGNDYALESMGKGWRQIVRRLAELVVLCN